MTQITLIITIMNLMEQVLSNQHNKLEEVEGGTEIETTFFQADSLVPGFYHVYRRNCAGS